MTLPPPPNAHALAVLILAVVALVLFTREKIPLESSSFLVLIGLAVGFEVFPFQVDGGVLHAVDFFLGFGHEALVAVCALMIAGQGIPRGGAGTRGKDADALLEGEPEHLPATDPCGRGLYQRVYK